MSTPYEDEDLDNEEDFYPLDSDVIEHFSSVVGLIRRNLSKLGPQDLKVAAVTLLALERLPRVTPGVSVVFGYQTPSVNGNWSWADISIGDDGLRLGVGEHFYDPSVGGDTESRTPFQAYQGGYEGSVREWLEIASNIFSEGAPSTEDYSDHDDIDWTV